MARDWQQEDNNYLQRSAKLKMLADIVDHFGVEKAEVVAQLEALKLTTRDGKGYKKPFVDPAIVHFERGLKPLYAGKWEEAKAHFEKLIAESEQADLTARARLFVDMCNRRLEKPGEIDDPYLEAVMAKNRGQLEAALELCNRSGRGSKEERFAYLAASVLALQGHAGQALALLRQSIEMSPTNRVQAYFDSDFASLRDLDEWDALFEGHRAAVGA